MASNQPSHIDEIKKILICSLCLDILKSPKTLPCTHSFCEECLQKYVAIQSVEGRTGIHCPLCRTFSKSGEFINIYMLHELLDVYWKCTKDIVPQCFMCESAENKALWKCVDCKIRLCDECQNVHEKIPNCKAHKYVPLDDDANHVIDENFYCESHPEQVIDLYCLNCKRLICLKCKVTDHDGHKSESVDDTLGSVITKVKVKVNTVENQLRKLQDEKLTLHRQRQEVEEEYVKQTNKCKEYKQEILSQLQQWEDDNLGRLAASKQENLGKLQKALELNERQTKVKENVVSLTNAILTNAKGCSLFKALTGEVKNRLLEQQKITLANVEISHKECRRVYLSAVPLEFIFIAVGLCSVAFAFYYFIIKR